MYTILISNKSIQIDISYIFFNFYNKYANFVYQIRNWDRKKITSSIFH